MNEKQLLFSDEARKKILIGAEKIARAVIATLGALGRNVVIHRGQQRKPLITKDGVTVAKEFKSLPDFYEDIGLQMVKDAASLTNDNAGDGTTTATLLAYEIMKAGMEHVSDGKNSIHIRNGINLAVKAVVEELDRMKVEVSDPESFKSIATVSSQDDEIGALVSLVVSEIGKDGAITVEPGQTIGIEYEKTEGMQLSRGFVSPHFINKKGKNMCVYEEPYILVTDERVLNLTQILPAVNLVHEKGGRLVVIAESIEHEALTALIYNLPWVQATDQKPDEKGNFESLAIQCPELGDKRRDLLEDIAAVTGARLISKSVGLSLESVTLDDFGMASKIMSSLRTSAIVKGSGDPQVVNERIERIKKMIDDAETKEEQDYLKGRLANITGSIGVIRVGAASEIEQREKQHRVEDAIAAVRAAADEGIVSGGGIAYLEARDVIDNLEFRSDDERTGAMIVKEALDKPLSWIVQNAGYVPKDVLKNISAKQSKGFGLNVETGEYCDMIKTNVIDPKKVSRCALENAASVAGAFLTVEVAMTDIPL